mgnify:FL=1
MGDEEVKKLYKKGIRTGAAIGALSVLLVCAIAVGIIFSLNYERKVKADRTTLALGDNVTSKINELTGIVDSLFLYDYDKDEMADNIYKAVMSSLDDPYSKYYTAEEYKELSASTEGVYYGIGATVTLNDDGYVRIVQTQEGSPAEEAGILAEDVITEVAGENVKGMKLDDIVSRMKGEEGTSVTLTIVRGDETLKTDVTRRKIDSVLVAGKMLDNNIGYIAISQFEGVTLEQFNNAFDDLKEQGMQGLIIDVRGNPGGRLDTVTDILDRLLPEGLIVYMQDKNGKREEIRSDAESDLDVPCAVLVNGNSASASEVFSGALQDYGLAGIIGTQTFGKGIVQSIYKLDDGSAVKLTTQDYYTPNGNNIHGIGITPDEVVELDEDAYKQDGTDTQLDAAVRYIMDKLQ